MTHYGIVAVLFASLARGATVRISAMQSGEREAG
jgi:hypothetical protein